MPIAFMRPRGNRVYLAAAEGALASEINYAMLVTICGSDPEPGGVRDRPSATALTYSSPLGSRRMALS